MVDTFTVFCLTPIHGSKKNVNDRIVDQRVTIFKTLFIAIETKTLTRYGQKVDFMIQLSDQVESWTIS